MKILTPFIFFSFFAVSCSRTYYVVRHAEKVETTDSAARNMLNDLPLSEAGKVRAIVLRDLLKNEKIKNIFSTNTSRTLNTAKPLSELIAVSIQQYSTKDTLDKFIERLTGIKKGNVLIICHSNTVDDIVNKLAGGTKLPGDLNESEYDNLYVVKYKRLLGRKISFKKRKYGYPSNP
ncbi:MAG: histidine phosphatase family protein [Bacteroidota bacterium]|nr:histidine phosphatase family protein [Bacteroidota bacterium]